MKITEFNTSEIESIIQKSGLEIEDKKVMTEIFSKFSSHYENFIDHISKKVFNSEHEEKDFEICSIIIPNSKVGEMEICGFRKIYEEESVFFQNEGLDFNLLEPFVMSNLYYTGKYFDKEKYLDKKYIGKITYKGNTGEEITEDLDYFLYDEEFENSQYEEKNKKIIRVIKNYKIKTGMGFNPFKTRMFCAYVPKINIQAQVEIDYCLEKNGLVDFEIGMVPMWNIDFEKVTPKISSKDSDLKTNYTFILEEKGGYIIPLKEDEYEQINEEQRLLIISSNGNEEFEKIKLNNIDKSKVQELLKQIDGKHKVYSNKATSSYYNKSNVSRVRTKADIESFINRYKDLFSIENYEISNKPLDIKKHFKNKFPLEDSLFNPEYKCKLYIKFSNEYDNVMYVDYLKFIFDELRDNYPEIHWIGGI